MPACLSEPLDTLGLDPGWAQEVPDAHAPVIAGVLTAWIRQRDQARHAGRALFHPDPHGTEDRWVDDPEALSLPDALTPALGTWLQRDPEGAARGVGDVTARVTHLWEELVARLSAARTAAREPPRTGPARALVSLDRLPPTLRARITTAHPEAVRDPFPAEASPTAPVDTARLPRDLAYTVMAAAGPPEITLFAGDGQLALRHLDARGITLTAAVEDPPYDTHLTDLPYRDQWPPGGWRAMMRAHVAGLRRVLAPHGVVVLHVDEHRADALRTVCIDTFGADNHLGTMVWDKRNPKGDATGLAYRHELILWATRDRHALEGHGGLTRTKPHAVQLLEDARQLVEAHGGVTEEARAAWRSHLRTHPDLTGGERCYRFLDDQGRPYRKVTMAWPNRREAPAQYHQPLIHPVTGEPCKLPARGFRNNPETMARLIAEGRILFGEDHTTVPTRKYLLSEVLREPLPSVVAWARSDDALLAHMGLSWPHAKPVGLLTQLLDGAAPHDDAVVADLFAGSGSTAEAWLTLDDTRPRRRPLYLAELDPTVREEVLIPRLLRLIRARSWRDGHPTGPGRSLHVAVVPLEPAAVTKQPAPS